MNQGLSTVVGNPQASAWIGSLQGSWVLVDDLEGESRWYAKALDVEPVLVGESIAVFGLGGSRLVLEQRPAPTEQPSVAVSGSGPILETQALEVETQRLAALGATPRGAAFLLDGSVRAQAFIDPMGRHFTLLENLDHNVARAVSQRAAERAALRNVRHSLDALQGEEAERRKQLKILKWIIGVAVVLVAITVTVVVRLASEQRSGAAFRLK